MTRFFFTTLLIVMSSYCHATDDNSVGKYEIRLASLRSEYLQEVVEFKKGYDERINGLKKAINGVLTRQLDLSLRADKIIAAKELLAGIEEFQQYQPSFSGEFTRMNFQNGTISEFEKNVQLIRDQLKPDLNKIESDFKAKSGALRAELIESLQSKFDLALTNKDLDEATSLRILINEFSKREPALFLKSRKEFFEGKAKLVGFERGDELRGRLIGSKWEWGRSGESLSFFADGTVVNPIWRSAGWRSTWMVIDQRTVLLWLDSQRDSPTVLSFDKDIEGYRSLGFGDDRGHGYLNKRGINREL